MLKYKHTAVMSTQVPPTPPFIYKYRLFYYVACLCNVSVWKDLLTFCIHYYSSIKVLVALILHMLLKIAE